MSVVTNMTAAASFNAFSFSNLPPQLAFIHETSPLLLVGSTFLILPLIVVILNVAWQLVSLRSIACGLYKVGLLTALFLRAARNRSSYPGTRHYRLSCSIGCPGSALPFPTAMTPSPFSFRPAKRCGIFVFTSGMQINLTGLFVVR